MRTETPCTGLSLAWRRQAPGFAPQTWRQPAEWHEACKRMIGLRQATSGHIMPRRRALIPPRDAPKGLESCVEGFAWAENNLGAQTPHELQGRGVNVFFAPMISPDEKVVNLANGRVERFVEGEPRPQAGYYAEYASLERFCRENGLPLTETDGQVSILPIGHEEAGDPLTHGGE